MIYVLICLFDEQGMLNKYNSKLEATLPVSFFTSAFRFGHSLIPNALERWSSSHKFIGSRRLSDIINKPFDVYTGNTCDEYLTGFMNQISQAVDDSVSQEVRLKIQNFPPFSKNSKFHQNNTNCFLIFLVDQPSFQR